MILLANPDDYLQKEALYIKTRTAEERVISNELLRQLPYPPADSRYIDEWRVRAKSFERFIKYLRKKHHNRQLNILDVGCGNGWMTNKLYCVGHKVTGLDLNLTELKQAEEVFGVSDGLKWVYADVLNNSDIPGAPFDIIILSASCQYFKNIPRLTQRLSLLLRDNGELHLLDSIFYKPGNIQSAKDRSQAYYTKLGVPEMSDYYFHHTETEMRKAGYKKQYPKFFNIAVLQWWILKK